MNKKKYWILAMIPVGLLLGVCLGFIIQVCILAVMDDTYFYMAMKIFALLFFGLIVIVFIMALLGKIESKPFHIKLSSDKKVATNTPSELEKCANCGRDIGRLEKTHVFKDNTVCAECYPRLKSQEQKA